MYIHTSNAQEVLNLASRRGVAVKVKVPGTDGTYVAINKTDFIRAVDVLINPLRPESAELDCVWYYVPKHKVLFPVEGANTYLIAAASDLYDAARAAHHYLCDESRGADDLLPVIEALQAAIAKIEGGE